MRPDTDPSGLMCDVVISILQRENPAHAVGASCTFVFMFYCVACCSINCMQSTKLNQDYEWSTLRV